MQTKSHKSSPEDVGCEEDSPDHRGSGYVGTHTVLEFLQHGGYGRHRPGQLLQLQHGSVVVVVACVVTAVVACVVTAVAVVTAGEVVAVGAVQTL